MDGDAAYFTMPEFPAGPWTKSASVELAARPPAVSRARRRLREILWEWKLDFLADDAELIFTELAVNAVNAIEAFYGMPDDAEPLRLRLLGDPSRLLIAVRDEIDCPPLPPDGAPSADSETGRGLLLLDALATRWHWYHPPRPHAGKVVWALLESESPKEDSHVPV